MLLPKLLAVALAASPAMVSAAIFPSNTQVKMIGPKGFREALKENVCLYLEWFMVGEADCLLYVDHECCCIRRSLVWCMGVHL